MLSISDFYGKGRMENKNITNDSYINTIYSKCMSIHDKSTENEESKIYSI